MEIKDIPGLEERLDQKANVAHPHATSDITGLVEALADKAPLDHEHDISDFPNLAEFVGQGFAPSVHNHSISQVTGLQTALDSKSASGHGHPVSQITGLQTALDSKSASGHGHSISEITGLQTALDSLGAGTPDTAPISNSTNTITSGAVYTALLSKAGASHSHEISEITGLSTLISASANVRADWGEANSEASSYIVNKPSLGTAALKNVGTALTDVAAGSHEHDASSITSGTLDLARLPAIPGVGAIIASGTEFSSLTTEQQSKIISGSTVVLSNGESYVFDGSGSKTDRSNYVQISSAGATDYTQLVNRPSNATSTVSGFMSAEDKVKLDGIANNANNYVHPTDLLHVPPTVVGSVNHAGKYLQAGTTAGTLTWATISGGGASANHSHGNLTSDGKISGATTSGLPVITENSGAITVGTTSTFAAGDHAHGNLTNDGKLSSITEPRVMVTTGNQGTVSALASSGTNGQVLRSNGPGLAPSWDSLPGHAHGLITNAGGINGASAHNLVVTGTGGAVQALGSTGTANQVLTSTGPNSAPQWKSLSTTSSVANLSGGSLNAIPYQTLQNENFVTAFISAPTSTPTNGFSILASGSGGNTANPPYWQTTGNIITKSQSDFVATDASRSITKIERITQQNYTTLGTKDPNTLYIVVG